MKNTLNNVNVEICDAVMYHVTQGMAESKNPSGKKFGRKMLRDTITMTLDHVKVVDFNVAIQWLIDNKYLKPLGQHTVGIGTGKDIKKYNLGDYTPYKQIDPKQLDTEQRPAQKIINPENQPKGIWRSFSEGARSIPKHEPLKADSSSSVTEDERREIDRVIQRDVPAFITKEHAEFSRIRESLNLLKARLNGKAIDNLIIKLRTLDELATLLDPEISNVLNQIHQDLKEMAQ